MENPEWVSSKAIEDAYRLYQNEEVDAEVSSTFFGSVKEKVDQERLEALVVSKPDANAGTSLARAVAAIFGGVLYPGKITLYRPFFSEFDIAIGPDNRGKDLGLTIRQRRAVVLLHELTHVTRRYVDAFQFLGMHYFDEAIYDQCTINERIYSACENLPEFKA